jgi:replicative DNA helicase
VLSPEAGAPHDVDAETSVLGAILLDPTVIARVRDLVDPDDFYRENNGTIYQAALNLFAEARPIDNTTVAGELARLGALQRVGGRGHLALLQESVPVAANAEHYAGMVRELAVKRRISAGALQVAQAANDRRAVLTDLGDRVEVLRDAVDREARWTPPLPLVDSAALPEFPLEALPGWCGAFAAALSEATQTPADLAGMIVLACLATCAGGRVRVEVKPGWEEPLNLYVLVALPPGERKSAVFESARSGLGPWRRW